MDITGYIAIIAMVLGTFVLYLSIKKPAQRV